MPEQPFQLVPPQTEERTTAAWLLPPEDPFQNIFSLKRCAFQTIRPVNTKWLFWGEGPPWLVHKDCFLPPRPPILPPTRFFQRGYGPCGKYLLNVMCGPYSYLFEIKRNKH